MGYSSSVYAKAFADLARTRQRNLDLFDRNKADIYAKQPRLQEIELRLANIAVGVLRSVLSGMNSKAAVPRLRDESLALQKERRSILRKMGLDETVLEPVFDCPLCKDTGYQDGVMCSCVRNAARTIAFSQLSAESPLELCTFESFDCCYYSDEKDGSGTSPKARMQATLQFCRDYAERFSLSSPNLLFKGNTGLGKTHLSLAIAATALKKGFGVIYGSAQNLLRRLEREHFGKADPQDDTLQVLLDCDLLVLDDLGAEFPSQFGSAAVYNLLNSRINLRHPTIISTNLSLDEIEQRYSDRVCSRILGNYQTRLFVGRDVRQEKLRELAKKEV